MLVREMGIAPTFEKSKSKAGEKDFGLTVGLAIAGLAVSTLGTFFSVLGYFRKARSGYSLEVHCGQVHENLDSASEARIEEIVVKITEAQEVSEISVHIHRVSDQD